MKEKKKEETGYRVNKARNPANPLPDPPRAQGCNVPFLKTGCLVGPRLLPPPTLPPPCRLFIGGPGEAVSEDAHPPDAVRLVCKNADCPVAHRSLPFPLAVPDEARYRPPPGSTASATRSWKTSCPTLVTHPVLG